MDLMHSVLMVALVCSVELANLVLVYLLVVHNAYAVLPTGLLVLLLLSLLLY